MLLRPWMQDDTTSPTVEDSTPNDRDGTLTNAGNTETSSATGTGYFAKSLQLDGVNDHIQFGDVGNFNYTQPFSGAIWIKPDAALARFQVFMVRQQPPPGLKGWAFRNSGTGTRQRLSFFLVGTSNQIERRSVNAIFTSSRWYHLGFSYDGSGSEDGITLFVDGVEIPSLSNGNSSVSSATTNAEHLSIGARAGDAGGAFDGSVGPAFLRAAETTAAEMAEDYAGPEPKNLIRPTLLFGPSGWTGDVGTWDSFANGSIAYTWQIRRVSDNGVEQSGTGNTPSGSNPADGDYYLWVRASNNGGYAQSEDATSTTATAGGNTGISITAAAGILSIAGKTGTVAAGHSINAGAGALEIRGHGATLTVGASVTIAAGVGAAAILSNASTVAAGHSINAEPGTLDIQGYAGSLTAGASVTIAAGVGTAAILSNAGTVAAGHSIDNSPGVVTITASNAAISAGVLLDAGAASLAVTGHEPIIVTAPTLTLDTRLRIDELRPDDLFPSL